MCQKCVLDSHWLARITHEGQVLIKIILIVSLISRYHGISIGFQILDSDSRFGC